MLGVCCVLGVAVPVPFDVGVVLVPFEVGVLLVPFEVGVLLVPFEVGTAVLRLLVVGSNVLCVFAVDTVVVGLFLVVGGTVDVLLFLLVFGVGDVAVPFLPATVSGD